MKRYIKSSADSTLLDDAIKKEFGSDSPSTGCSFIARDGQFINIYPKLDVHEDLCYWVTENLGVEIKYPDEEYFINAFGYIRLRSDPNMMIIEMPEFAPSNSQWYSLQDWLDYCQEKYRRRVTLDISVYGSSTEVNVQYDFGTEYFSDDVIKVLKRYYSSGKLYASTNNGGHMKRYILSSTNDTFILAVVDSFGRDVGYVFRYQQGGYYHPGSVIKVSTDLNHAKTYGSEVAAKRAAAQYRNYSEVYVYDGSDMPTEKIPSSKYSTHLEVVRR